MNTNRKSLITTYIYTLQDVNPIWILIIVSYLKSTLNIKRYRGYEDKLYSITLYASS